MTARTSFNRLILRAVLRNVSPMVIRVISVPDSLDLADFDDLPHCSRLGQFRVHLPGSWPGVQGVTPQFPILTCRWRRKRVPKWRRSGPLPGEQFGVSLSLLRNSFPEPFNSASYAAGFSSMGTSL